MLSVFVHSPSGKGVLTGHADGTIVKYMFEEDGGNTAAARVRASLVCVCILY